MAEQKSPCTRGTPPKSKGSCRWRRLTRRRARGLNIFRGRELLQSKARRLSAADKVLRGSRRGQRAARPTRCPTPAQSLSCRWLSSRRFATSWNTARAAEPLPVRLPLSTCPKKIPWRKENFCWRAAEKFFPFNSILQKNFLSAEKFFAAFIVTKNPLAFARGQKIFYFFCSARNCAKGFPPTPQLSKSFSLTRT